MAYQRRRGIPIKLWKNEIQEDDRGNKHVVPVELDAHQTKAWIFPQRSGKAEVPGQAHINVVRVGVSADLEGVDLFGKVEFLGRDWDIVTPPSYHHGTRLTRHWSIDLRERP
jgi:hypothetical protein